MKALVRRDERDEGVLARYGDWLDEGMEQSVWSGAARLVVSVGGTCTALTALIVGVFALLGWV